MILVSLTGGLGNQMFQYAAGFTLASKYNTLLCLDPRGINFDPNRQFQLDCFDYAGRLVNLKEKWLVTCLLSTKPGVSQLSQRLTGYRVYCQQDEFFDPAVFELGERALLKGYFASYKYVSSATLEKAFGFKQHTKRVDDWARQMANPKSVSLHIRRGDYLSNKKFAQTYPVLPLDYYKKALSYLEKQLGAGDVFVFTDDKTWAKQHLKNFGSQDISVVEHDGADSEDLYLMSQCQHHITANSTFSWWGSYLSKLKGITITPKQWYLTNQSTKDLLPPDWVQM